MKIGDKKKVNGMICEFVDYTDLDKTPDITLKFKKLDGLGHHFVSISLINSIEELTPQEIQAVKPCFKRGDVVVSDEFSYGGGGKKGFIIYRFSREVNGGLHKVESMIRADGLFVFDESCGTCDKRNQATPDQIKQLELEEMKHGKKWNGDGYDDWLTEDGLTWLELMEHDFELMEYKFNEGSWSDVIDSVTESDLGNIQKLRLKPKESFVDVEICWKTVGHSFAPFCIPPWEKSEENISVSPIGQVCNGWSLSGYIHDDQGDNDCTFFSDKSIMFNDNGRKLICKAHHARFVRVGE